MSDKPDLPPEAPGRAKPSAGSIDQPPGAPPDEGGGHDAEGGGPEGDLPTRQDRSGLEPPISTDEEPPAGTSELDRR